MKEITITYRSAEIVEPKTNPRLIEIDHGGIVTTVSGAYIVKRLGLAVDLVDELADALPRCEHNGCSGRASKAERREGPPNLFCELHAPAWSEDCAWAAALRRAKEHGFL